MKPRSHLFAVSVLLLLLCAAGLIAARRVPLQDENGATTSTPSSPEQQAPAPAPVPTALPVPTATPEAAPPAPTATPEAAPPPTTAPSATSEGADSSITYDSAAEDAFFKYVVPCGGPTIDPKAMCGNLAGNMCSLKPRVKCGYNRVDFLDAKGAVIAIGDEVTQKICYEAGPRKGVCKEAPLVVTAPPEPSPSSAGSDTIDPDTVTAFWTFSRLCEGGRFCLTGVTKEKCLEFSGKLCERKRVQCSKGKTDFLDAAGNVIAQGNNDEQWICYKAGPKKGTCDDNRGG